MPDATLTGACRRSPLLAGAVLAAFCLSVAAPADAQKAKLAKPSLEIIDSTEAPWTAVGRVNVAGYRQTYMCTGTLVGPSVVLTAAHCLYNLSNGKRHKAKDIHFVAGVRREKYAARTKGKCVRIHPDYTFIAKPKVKDIQNDVALLILQEPLDIAPVPMAESHEDAATTVLMSAGYFKNRRYLPTADRNCRILKDLGGSWLTSCLTNHGASGGPIFDMTGGTLKVTAVMSAMGARDKSLVVPYGRWRPLFEGRTCTE